MRGIKNFSQLVMQQPCALSEVIQYQAGFYINPGNADIAFSTMPEIGIECFGSRGTKENSAQDPESFGIHGQQFNCVNRTQRFENMKIIQQMTGTQHGHHAKPDKHDGSE